MVYRQPQLKFGQFAKRFFWIGGLALIFILGVSLVFSQLILQQRLTKLGEDFDQHLSLVEYYVTAEVEGVADDLDLVASSTALTEYLKSDDAFHLRRLQNRFSDFINFRRCYDQIRLLDPQGKELVRVNFSDGKARAVAQQELQNKAHRYYFKEAIAMPPGRVYASRLDLNMENQQIETPFKPVIRVATKVLNDDGSVGGVVVLNYLASRLLNGIDNAYGNKLGKPLLIDQDGYYLKGLSPHQEWGFMLPERRHFNLAQENPGLMQAIQRQTNGLFQNGQGAYGFRTITPVDTIEETTHRQASGSSNLERWVLLAFLPEDQLAAILQQHAEVYILGVVLLGVFALSGAFVLSRSLAVRDNYNLRSRQLLKAMEQNPLGIALATPAGMTQYANRSYSKITGQPRGQTLGSLLWCLDENEVSADDVHRINAAIDAGLGWQGRVHYRRTSGEISECELLLSWVAEPKSDQQLVVVLRDMSREVSLESQLRQAQKMEAFGQLAAGVAHDFNNLLQVILGMTGLALNRLSQEDPQRKRLEEVMQAGEKGAMLTRQLLTFSQKKQLDRELFDPDQLVAGILTMLQRILGEQVNVSFTPEGDVHPIRADQNMFEQAVINLCINARDAMPEGGELRIDSSIVVADNPINEFMTPGSLSACWYRLSISDSGSGIPVELQEHIFEPFFSTKQTSKGTGLGLAMVYSIVKQHQGFIDLASEPGKGTTFHLYFPVENGAQVSGRFASDSLDFTTGHGETILLAEDDAQVRKFTASLLEETGYKVLQAENGLEAIELFDQNRETIALALLDVIMPLMNGRQVLNQIRNHRGDLPIIFASGYQSDLLQDADLEQLNVEIIQKPYVPSQLLQRIATCLGAENNPPG